MLEQIAIGLCGVAAVFLSQDERASVLDKPRRGGRMNDLPKPLTPAERAFWRCLWRQSEKERRINERVLADMLSGKPMRKRRTRKVSP